MEVKHSFYSAHLAAGEISIEVAWPPWSNDLAVESVCRPSRRQVGAIEQVPASAGRDTDRAVGAGTVTYLEELIAHLGAFFLSNLLVDILVSWWAKNDAVFVQCHVVWEGNVTPEASRQLFFAAEWSS